MSYSRESKNRILKALRNVPIQEHFSNPVDRTTIDNFERQRWMAFPNDYKSFVEKFGEGGIGFHILGVRFITENIQVFRAVKEAKRMADYTPLENFLVIEYDEIQNSTPSFYYIPLNSYRIEQETLPVYYWNGDTQLYEEAYPDFYSYFYARILESKEMSKHKDLSF